jgi:hypothetical protein
LRWHPATGEKTPPSKPEGNPFDVIFVNSRTDPSELFWMQPDSGAESYGTIAPGKLQRRKTRPGAVWEIRTPSGNPLGHFIIGDRAAKAVIPPSK